MTQNVLEMATQANNEEIDHLTADLIAGRAKDFADYKWHCGIIRGLRKANNQLEDVSLRVMEEDDDG